MEGTLSSVKPFVLSSFDGKCHLLFHLLGFVLQRAAQWAVLVPSGQCPLWSSHFDCLLRIGPERPLGGTQCGQNGSKLPTIAYFEAHLSEWMGNPFAWKCLCIVWNFQLTFTVSIMFKSAEQYRLLAINDTGALWWPNMQFMKAVPLEASGGQICKLYRLWHLVAEFATNASCGICWPNLQVMHVVASCGQIYNLCKLWWPNLQLV